MEDSPALPPQPPVAPDPLALDLLRQSRVINARLKELGREPVWKDWDASFDFFGKLAEK